MVFRQTDGLQKDDFQHAVFLAISVELFIELFDVLAAKADAALVEQGPTAPLSNNGSAT